MPWLNSGGNGLMKNGWEAKRIQFQQKNTKDTNKTNTKRTKRTTQNMFSSE